VDVSVIIVSYNSRSALEPCLESLKTSTVFQYTEVIVVDNASSDGTPQMIRDRFPWVNLHAGTENVGFSRGVNAGIQAAKGKYFLILNPDTVLREDTIESLGKFMEQTPDAGIVGPKLVFHDGNLQYSCRKFYNWRVLLFRRTFLGKIFKKSKAVSDHLMLDYDHKTTRDVDWILGACMFVRREAVETVGLMDERFFLYFEDVDWCYRMKQKGWKVYYNPESVVVHNYARDSAHSVINRSFVAHLASLVRYYEKWNFVWYFIKKHRGILKTLLFLGVDLIAFNLAFLSAYYLRDVLDSIFPNPIFEISAYERFVIFENLLFVFTYSALGLYKIRRETKAIDEFFDVTRAIVLASVLLMASTYLGQIRTYSRMVVAFLVPFAILYDWSFRQMVRRAHRKLLAQKIDLKRVCVVGPPDRANELERRLVADPALGVEVVGIVDSGSGDEPGGTWAVRGLSELNAMVDRYRIQEVIFVPGAVSDEQVADFVTMARRRVVDVTVVADYAGMVIHQAQVTDLAGRPAIAYRREARYVLDRIAKRALDIGLGTGFLVVSAPFSVLYFAYASIRGGKAYSSDERLGLGGKPFMLPIAGSSNGPSDIVNLPLFWLVITGKMSMVGPYPLPASESRMLGTGTGFRFDLRPGVTGFWRSGRDEEIPMEELLAQDAKYARNWSFIQDLKILITSTPNMLFGRKRILKLKNPLA